MTLKFVRLKLVISREQKKKKNKTSWNKNLYCQRQESFLPLTMFTLVGISKNMAGFIIYLHQFKSQSIEMHVGLC